MDGRKVQIVRSTRIGKQVLHVRDTGTTESRLGPVRDDYMEAVNAIENLRQQPEQPSIPPILPRYQTRQRPFQERHRAER